MDNLRRAILLFSAVVLVSAAVVGFVLALDYYNASDATVVDLKAPGDKFSESENTEESDKEVSSKNILIMIGDKTKKSAEIISVMNFDPIEKKISMMFIPCDVKYSLEENSGVVSNGVLRDYYGKNGGEKTCLVVSGMYDISIDRYVYMSFDDFSGIVNRLNSIDGIKVKFEMPVSISSVEQNINISKGNIDFDGNISKQLITFVTTDDDIYDKNIINYYDGTEICRVNMTASFVNELFAQKVLSQKDEKYSELFSDRICDVFTKFDKNISDEEIRDFCNAIKAFEREGSSFYISDYINNKVCVSKLTGICEKTSLSDAEITSLLSERFNSEK